jgi:hypothetical protein
MMGGMAPRQAVQVPAVTDDEQRSCARGDWCAASTRDAEGNWHPALTWQPYCPACTSRIVTCLTELPPLYALLTSGTAALARATGKVRVPPGPRILVSPAAEALAREASAVLAGWAARVRDTPGLRLSPPRHPPGTPGRVREDCNVMARHPGPLMALPDGWTTRAYDLPEAAVPLNRAQGACRRCGRTVTRSPASGWWWACDGQAAGFCDHDPGPAPEATVDGPVPGGLGFHHRQPEDLSEEEIVSIGDGWVKVMRRLSAVHAGAEILGLHWHARRLTGQVPASPEVLDGMPCRSCEAMSALAVLEQPPPDPALPPPRWTRCAECGDEMTRPELTAWAVMYAAWVRGSGLLTCRRCEMRPDLDRHPECAWAACDCCRGRGRAAA